MNAFKIAEVFNNYFIDIFKSSPENCSNLSQEDEKRLLEVIDMDSKNKCPFEIPQITSQLQGNKGTVKYEAPE
jgi:hypothetical protein